MVREGDDRRAVAGRVGRQRRSQLRPLRLGVERVEHGVVELPHAGDAAPAGRRRCCRRGAEQCLQRGGGVRARVPRAGGAAGTPGEERVEHVLEAVGLPLGDLVERQRGVDDAVEHHGPDVGREQRGVGEPQQRAVGLAHVGQRAVPERLAQPVHVAGDVDRPDVRKQVGAVLLARGRELLQALDACGLLTRRGRRGVRWRAACCRSAGHRVAALDAPGVEEDDVEVVEQLRRQRAELVGHVVDARHPRAAGVDDQRADAGSGILGRMARHRDRDGRSVGVRVVQRDDEGAALEIAVAG